MTAHVNLMDDSRLKAMVVPREHGAWGMLLVPLATGAAVALPSGANLGALSWFVLAAMSLFWLRTPLETWLGTSAIKVHSEQERRLALSAVAAISLLSAGSITALLWDGRNRGLGAIGGIAATAFVLQGVVKRLGRKGRMPAQVIGAIGLTSTAAGAYYVSTGKLDPTAIALWLANWLFAGNQIHFVQVRIRAGRAATMNEKMRQAFPFFFGQILLIGFVLAACRFGIFPGTIALVFVPILFRGTFWFVRGRQPLDVHKLGFSELAHAVVFGTLLCAAFLI